MVHTTLAAELFHIRLAEEQNWIAAAEKRAETNYIGLMFVQ